MLRRPFWHHACCSGSSTEEASHGKIVAMDGSYRIFERMCGLRTAAWVAARTWGHPAWARRHSARTSQKDGTTCTCYSGLPKICIDSGDNCVGCPWRGCRCFCQKRNLLLLSRPRLVHGISPSRPLEKNQRQTPSAWTPEKFSEGAEGHGRR